MATMQKLLPNPALERTLTGKPPGLRNASRPVCVAQPRRLAGARRSAPFVRPRNRGAPWRTNTQALDSPSLAAVESRTTKASSVAMRCPRVSHHRVIPWRRLASVACLLGSASISAYAGGYSACQSPGDPRPHLECGKGCPAGDRFVSYQHGDLAGCEAPIQSGCERIANLHYDLGWQGGNKSKFCRARGFEYGMVNLPNSNYKEQGGGWCYRGDRQACNDSLPSRRF
jgi:hypothetical protein